MPKSILNRKRLTGLSSSNASVFASDLHESTFNIGKEKKNTAKEKCVLEQKINNTANRLTLAGELVTPTLQFSPRFEHSLEVALSLGLCLFYCRLKYGQVGKKECILHLFNWSKSTGTDSKMKTELSVNLGRHFLRKHFCDQLPSGLVMVFVIIP